MEPQQKRTHVMVERLYDAALTGDVNCLINLLQEDSLILDRCIIEKSGHSGQSPLHVVANRGHRDFAKEILERKPELVEELNKSERSSSALHMAVIKGHLHIVTDLVAVNTHICLAKDQDGMNPLHVAAIRGKIAELKVLVLANPQAARERTSGGDTILNLCVKHKQPMALEYLVDANDDFDLLNAKDNDGNTALHLAILANQLRMVQFLLRKPNIEQNAINNNGFTAMDTFNQKDARSDNQEILKALKGAKAYSSKNVKAAKNKAKDVDIHSWLERQRNALMVVASLIATMAFQVGVNPPGGVWQDEILTYDESDPRFRRKIHVGGTSIMSTLDSVQYNKLLISNTIGFLSSLSVILLLISGLPCKRFFVSLLMIVMWVSITATTITYLLSVGYLAITKLGDLDPKGSGVIRLASTTYNVIQGIIYFWWVVNMILLFGYGIRFTLWLIKRWFANQLRIWWDRLLRTVYVLTERLRKLLPLRMSNVFGLVPGGIEIRHQTTQI